MPMADESSPTDGVSNVLVQLQRILAEHPDALRALAGALASEGRAYAETPEGRDLRERLVRSEYATRLRSVWDIVSFDVSRELRPSLLPSTAIESLVRSILQPGFESHVHRAIRSRGRGRNEDAR
jgi:hypothetical protein